MAAHRDSGLLSVDDRNALYSIELEVLGERIRRGRLEKKISQRDLSKDLFTSAYLSSLELGKTRPTPDTLLRLAERLDKSIDYFLRQNTGMVSELDEEQARTLEVRIQLLSAQSLLLRSADDRAERALQQVALHMARLSNTERARYHYLLGCLYNAHKDPTRALEELEQANRYLQDSSDPELEVLIGSEIGRAHYDQRRIMPALTHFTSALEAANSSVKPVLTNNLRWKLYMQIANCYLLLNDWEQALKAFQESLNDAKTATDLRSQAESYYSIANAYSEQGDFLRACLHLGRALQIFEQLDDQNKLLRARNALAQMQVQNNQFDAAEEQAQEALRLAQTSFQEDRCHEMNTLITMALIRQKQDRLNDASVYVGQALNLSNGCENLSYQGRLYQTAAEIEAEKNNREASAEYYEKALALLKPSDAANALADVYHSYGQRLRTWGEVDRAFEYMEMAYKQRERGRNDAEAQRR
jgi:tetratricopeptide (TPR) repeat protein